MGVQLVKLAADAVIALVAFFIALAALSGADAFTLLTGPSGVMWFGAAAAYGLFAVGASVLMQSYRGAWRFVSFGDVLTVSRVAVISAGCLLAALFVLNRAADLPRITFLLATFFHALGMGAVRVFVRLLYERRLLGVIWPLAHTVRRGNAGEPLIIIGDPARFEALARRPEALAGQGRYASMLISTVDGWRGQRIHGVEVVGHARDLDRILDWVLGLGSDTPRKILVLDQPKEAGLTAARFAQLTEAGFTLLRAPQATELVEREVDRPELRRLDVEDLLFRPPVDLDVAALTALIRDKRVLVTGAGGSIGSEICRQAAALGCAHLTMLDFSEQALLAIDAEIAERRPSLSRREIYCDVRDRQRIEQCMLAERPDLVFHAAALKHVPVVERHPSEGALTNLVGTRNVAEASRAAGVAVMTFISTDKAVDPTNVMGATKRIAEEMVRALDQEADGETDPRFVAVRFGNVLGSNGSVAPLFREQILRGGPVTVTDPNVERYFMTIREAVQLVLHATALGAVRPRERSVVYVLEMGEPVKIDSLARQMIEAYGRTPGVDIEIVYVGLRPGEKLTEALIDANETAAASPRKGILEVTAGRPPQGLPGQIVLEFERMARRGDDASVRGLIWALLKARSEPPPAQRRTA